MQREWLASQTHSSIKGGQIHRRPPPCLGRECRLFLRMEPKPQHIWMIGPSEPSNVLPLTGRLLSPHLIRVQPSLQQLERVAIEAGVGTPLTRYFGGWGGS